MSWPEEGTPSFSRIANGMMAQSHLPGPNLAVWQQQSVRRGSALRSNLNVLKLGACTAALVVSASLAAQGQESSETVIVTGSRVISNAMNSPTPITVVSAETLQATTPTGIPDALNKLPDFAGSRTQRTVNNASTNATGNVLNLRNFGGNRTLLLFDGHRVVASNSDGTTDADTLPQMLMSRVDVVTGGASAVYGSDAVTGVVNFVLNKNFSGVKYDVNAGIAGIGVATHYQAGIAAGSDVLGGRGHIEGSFKMYHQDHVPLKELPYGKDIYVTTGVGTSAANPITTTKNGRVANTSFGGYIQNCGTGCTVANQQFVGTGVIGPFTAGLATGTAGAQGGGDGAYAPDNDAQAGLKTFEAFGRFGYNLDNTTNVYIQLSASQSQNYNHFYNFSNTNGTNVYFKNNPYLSPAAQAALNTGSGTTFISSKYFTEFPGISNRGVNRNLGVTTGADGSWGDYTWDVFYSHYEDRLTVDNIGNIDNSHLIASNDAVVAPAGNSAGVAAGTIVCNVTLTNPGLYPGCLPLNAFGPNSANPDVFGWLTKTTNFHETNVLDDVGGTLSGSVFDLPAGPLKAAVSGDMRWVSLEINSLYTPSQLVNCTGLSNCKAGTVYWGNNTLAPLSQVSENVWEVSGELDVPLLKDMPLVQTFDVNLAGRYTNYSVTGAVQTWKMGLDYHVNDDIRFRGTTSVDIRAPNLNDLFGPVQANISGYNDLHTQTTGATIVQQTGGNPALVPEVARTYTGGIILTPTFIPGLSLSADYYQIVLKNAISNINGTNAVVANLCEASKPAYDSPYCSLYIRPLPFTNTTSANFPTLVKSSSLNAAYQAVSGVDIEVDYSFDVADVVDLPGSISIRELLGMQPVNETQPFTGQPFNYTSQPKNRSTTFVNYTNGSWTITLLDRWISGYKKATNFTTIYYTDPRVPAQNYFDINVSKQVNIGNVDTNVYLSVENVFNNFGPIVGSAASAPGFSYSVPNSFPAVGRSFTLGIRGTF